MDKATTRMIEDTASNLNNIAKIGREGWNLFWAEVQKQDDVYKILSWLADGPSPNENEED